MALSGVVCVAESTHSVRNWRHRIMCCGVQCICKFRKSYMFGTDVACARG